MEKLCFPSPNSEQFEWQEFHSDISKKNPKTLDLLIRTIESAIFLEQGRKQDASKEDPIYYSPNINKDSLFMKFYEFIKSQYQQENIEDQEDIKKHQWNTSSNLLRGLKYLKQNTLFLLKPLERKKLSEFVNSLKYSPIETNFY